MVLKMYVVTTTVLILEEKLDGDSSLPWLGSMGSIGDWCCTVMYFFKALMKFKVSNN